MINLYKLIALMYLTVTLIAFTVGQMIRNYWTVQFNTPLREKNDIQSPSCKE